MHVQFKTENEVLDPAMLNLKIALSKFNLLFSIIQKIYVQD